MFQGKKLLLVLYLLQALLQFGQHVKKKQLPAPSAPVVKASSNVSDAKLIELNNLIGKIGIVSHPFYMLLQKTSTKLKIKPTKITKAVDNDKTPEEDVDEDLYNMF